MTIAVIQMVSQADVAQNLRDARRLLERGLGEETVGNIFWNNAIGVMECAVCDHAK